MSTADVFITPTIIRQALRKLKPRKGDGDRGFKSDHLSYSTHRFISCYAMFVFSSFFFFRKNYLLLSCVTSVRPSVRRAVRLSVCGNNFFSR